MDSRTGLPIVGMVGGGQLARMTHQAAIPLGQSLRVLVNSTDDAAALVAGDVRVGDHTDLAALKAFAKGVDVLTFDHEHVPNEHVKALADGGVVVRPAAEALRYAQDKHAMRARLGLLGLPVPRWSPVTTLAEVETFAGGQWPVVGKATWGGYDGKGVWMLSGAADAKRLIDESAGSTRGRSGTVAPPPGRGPRLIVEEKVPLVRELAVVVARSPFGQVAAYPVVETVQVDGICVEVLAPAPDLAEHLAVAAQRLAIEIATELDVVGILAVELFETDGGLLVNELAMRPHNSAHWTIEGARTSQFEQHLRAVLDYPLGDTSLQAPAVCMANLLGGEPGGMGIDERLHHLFAADPGVKVHLYGKAVRPGRKIGHVTVVGEDMTDVRARAVRAVQWLRTASRSGGH